MTSTKTFPDPAAVANGFAADFAAWVESQPQATLTVALSGGSTPKALFKLWADEYADKVDWSRIHFYWGDERCVPPEDSESNFGVAKALFLNPVGVPTENVHRVLGEADPEQERVRYEQEIDLQVKTVDSVPKFDMIILGMGDDGHTASIFPHQSEFLKSSRVCEVATHPDSGQQRITLTGKVLNAATKVVFLIAGGNKADVLAQVIEKSGGFAEYPAAHVAAEDVSFYIDEAAGSKLS